MLPAAAQDDEASARVPTGADVVGALDRDAQEVAAQEDNEANIAESQGLEAEAAPAEAAAAAASTRGPMRRAPGGGTSRGEYINQWGKNTDTLNYIEFM